MRYLVILAAFFLACTGCKNCPCEDALKNANPDIINVQPPRGDKESGPSNSIVVTINSENKFFIASQAVSEQALDSLLKVEIQKQRAETGNEVTVVINADRAAYYGNVFRIMRTAKKDSAKVVARVEGSELP